LKKSLREGNGLNQFKNVLYKYILSCLVTIALSISFAVTFMFFTGGWFYFLFLRYVVYVTVPAVVLIGLPSAIIIKKIMTSIKWRSKLVRYLVESLLFLIFSFVGTVIILKVLLNPALNFIELSHYDKIYFIYGFLCALIFQACLNIVTAIDAKQKEILSLIEEERD
jgi:uncharacterized membrane protein